MVDDGGFQKDEYRGRVGLRDPKRSADRKRVPRWVREQGAQKAKSRGKGTKSIRLRRKDLSSSQGLTCAPSPEILATVEKQKTK